MFLEMFPQYIVNVIAHRQLPFTGNADDDRYFPVQFLVYIDTLPAFAFVRGMWKYLQMEQCCCLTMQTVIR